MLLIILLTHCKQGCSRSGARLMPIVGLSGKIMYFRTFPRLTHSSFPKKKKEKEKSSHSGGLC